MLVTADKPEEIMKYFEHELRLKFYLVHDSDVSCISATQEF